MIECVCVCVCVCLYASHNHISHSMLKTLTLNFNSCIFYPAILLCIFQWLLSEKHFSAFSAPYHMHGWCHQTLYTTNAEFTSEFIRHNRSKIKNKKNKSVCNIANVWGLVLQTRRSTNNSSAIHYSRVYLCAWKFSPMFDLHTYTLSLMWILCEVKRSVLCHCMSTRLACSLYCMQFINPLSAVCLLHSASSSCWFTLIAFIRNAYVESFILFRSKVHHYRWHKLHTEI